jgi:hypothetical protein
MNHGHEDPFVNSRMEGRYDTIKKKFRYLLDIFRFSFHLFHDRYCLYFKKYEIYIVQNGYKSGPGIHQLAGQPIVH